MTLMRQSLQGSKACSLLVGLMLTYSYSPLAHSEFRPRSLPSLRSGMSIADVLRSWGAPTEKFDRECKREELWHYPAEHSVVFYEGRISKWNSPNFEVVNVAPAAPLPATFTRRAKVATEHDKYPVEELLQELLQQPSTKETPEKPAVQDFGISTINPPRPPVIQPEMGNE